MSSCEELINLGKRDRKKRNEEVAQLLLGMKARSQIDRKLMLGVIQERPYRDIEKKEDPGNDQVSRHNPVLTLMNL